MPDETLKLMEQRIHITSDGLKVLVLKPAGRLDITSAWQFRRKLQECIAEYRYVVLNLAQVPFIDSSGLAALVAGMRDAEKIKGYFRISNVNSEAYLVFEVTMMDTVFEIFADEAAALESRVDGIA